MRDLTLRFGGNIALNGLSVELYEGELLSIVGPNGAGKTSLFNCISGVYRPERGDVLLEGRSVIGLPPYQLARLGVSRTFQSVELFSMSVVQNILVGRQVKMKSGLLRASIFAGFTAREERHQRRRAEEILDFLEIGRYRHDDVEHLPLGVQKRVEMGRALALEPRLLLLDEPTAGMNRAEKEDIARIILRIRRELGISLALIEHDMRFVMDLSDRVCVMNFGEELATGAPKDVANNEQVIRAYLGDHA
ncbi:ABC transporter ATP-binding protein [Pseudonocardia nigra]|uniref:ABC transporter ATP-binding protein n=1 Tax=Pseudonocardia nigra TaxID=1921578 RepID=UPI0027E2261F|nr:ABC transporter ATP-binding protein [Pseudonocardia nigra]